MSFTEYLEDFYGIDQLDLQPSDRTELLTEYEDYVLSFEFPEFYNE